MCLFESSKSTISVNICYSPDGRSVLGKTVPEVLDTRQRAQFFPIQTDLSW